MLSACSPCNHGILSLVLAIVSPYGWFIGQSQGYTVTQVTEPFYHTEGPHWDHGSQYLFFVDIAGQKINRLDPETGEVTTAYIADGPVGVAVPVKDCADTFLAGVGLNFDIVTWDSDYNTTDAGIEILASVDADRDIGTRFNDGKVDSRGRMWAGTMGPEDESGTLDPDQGSLYLFGSDLTPVKEISPVNISNGLAWNSDDTVFYYIDSPSLEIVAYDFDADEGTISNRRVVFDLSSANIAGVPDGMTIDADDNLWIAVFNGGVVLNVDPIQCKLIRYVEIPATRVTSVAFGGSLLDILYVTTARIGLTDEEIEDQPLAGSVFAISGLGVSGRPSNSFVL